MTKRTVIGIFEHSLDIAPLQRDLSAAGFTDNEILILHGSGAAPDPPPTRDRSDLTTLFQDRGIPGPEAAYFAEITDLGKRVVSVQASTLERAVEAEAILNRHGAIDIEEQFTQWRSGNQADKSQQTASSLSAATRDKSATDNYQTGRTRNSLVFVW